MHAEASVKAHDRPEDFVTDLLFIIEAFLDFFIGIETLKHNGGIRLLGNVDYWTWPFFLEAFRLLDAIMMRRWLHDHDEWISLNVHSSYNVVERSSSLDVASNSYANFRLTGNMQELRKCANALCLIIIITHWIHPGGTYHWLPSLSYPGIDATNSSYPGVGDIYPRPLISAVVLSGNNNDVDIDKRTRVDEDIPTNQLQTAGRSYTSDKIPEDIPKSSQRHTWTKPTGERVKLLPNRLARLERAPQHFLVVGEKWTTKSKAPRKHVQKPKSPKASLRKDLDKTTVSHMITLPSPTTPLKDAHPDPYFSMRDLSGRTETNLSSAGFDNMVLDPPFQNPSNSLHAAGQYPSWPSSTPYMSNLGGDTAMNEFGFESMPRGPNLGYNVAPLGSWTRWDEFDYVGPTVSSDIAADDDPKSHYFQP
ncbi:hypothetical protein BJ165DRAFT_128581 [Panaeolus papilionaceus]|nr:hypothetical protein BJ165DRAFT_128581 [Panaeolus papilionaceus]